MKWTVTVISETGARWHLPVVAPSGVAASAAARTGALHLGLVDRGEDIAKCVPVKTEHT